MEERHIDLARGFVDTIKTKEYKKAERAFKVLVAEKIKEQIERQKEKTLCESFPVLKENKETLSSIAQEIMRDWKNIYFGARPYLNAMLYLDSVNDKYGYDSGRSIVAYFLANAGTWKGPKAKEIKAKLKKMLAEK